MFFLQQPLTFTVDWWPHELLLFFNLLGGLFYPERWQLLLVVQNDCSALCRWRCGFGTLMLCLLGGVHNADWYLFSVFFFFALLPVSRCFVDGCFWYVFFCFVFFRELWVCGMKQAKTSKINWRNDGLLITSSCCCFGLFRPVSPRFAVFFCFFSFAKQRIISLLWWPSVEGRQQRATVVSSYDRRYLLWCTRVPYLPSLLRAEKQ